MYVLATLFLAIVAPHKPAAIAKIYRHLFQSIAAILLPLQQTFELPIISPIFFPFSPPPKSINLDPNLFISYRIYPSKNTQTHSLSLSLSFKLKSHIIVLNTQRSIFLPPPCILTLKPQIEPFSISTHHRCQPIEAPNDQYLNISFTKSSGIGTIY